VLPQLSAQGTIMIDIYTHGNWCHHCKFNIISEETHHETCEVAALRKEVKELREENMLMREIMMASYAPRPWVVGDEQ